MNDNIDGVFDEDVVERFGELKLYTTINITGEELLSYLHNYPYDFVREVLDKSDREIGEILCNILPTFTDAERGLKITYELNEMERLMRVKEKGLM